MHIVHIFFKFKTAKYYIMQVHSLKYILKSFINVIKSIFIHFVVNSIRNIITQYQLKIIIIYNNTL